MSMPKKTWNNNNKKLQENSDKIIHDKGYDDETQLLERLKKMPEKKQETLVLNFKTQIRSTRYLQSIFWAFTVIYTFRAQNSPQFSRES